MGYPWPSGTLVRCLHQDDDMPVLRSCEHHIFITVGDPQPVDYGCGYAQVARCLVCDRTTPPLDAAWWYHRASGDDLRACAALVRTEALRLEDVHSTLLGWAPTEGHPQPLVQVLRDFG